MKHKKQFYQCPFGECDKIFSNRGMFVWHLRRHHKLSSKEENELDWSALEIPEPEPVNDESKYWENDEGDQILIWAHKKADRSLTPVYCSKCGELIAMIEMLVTPTTFKLNYGEFCKHCKKPLGDSFKIRNY